MIEPVFDYALDGLRHRKTVFPSRRYEDGGATSERWVYIVGTTPYVVTFTVVTARYPEGWDTNLKPYGAEEVAHHATGSVGCYPCLYLDGAPCEGDGSGIDAAEWYAAQPKNAEGFVTDADVFAHLRDLYARWSQP